MGEYQKSLPIEEFVTLLLAILANDSKMIDLDNKDKKIVSLPSNYKQIIENILCAENGWKEKFSILIDTEDYFDDHFGWETNLAFALEKVLKELNKDVCYNFLTDRILVEFNQKEIDMIIDKYQDEYLKNTMNHFANLLNDYIYTRSFQEKFYDYSALAVDKMKKLNREKNTDDNFLNNKNKKKLRLFRKK